MIYFYCWKKFKKTCIFTQKWLDHLLFMTSYLVTIATDHHGTCRKMRARDELTATSSGADVLSSGKKKTQKIGRGGGGGTGGIQPSLGRWVPVFCFTQFGGAFPCLNFSKLCGTSPLIRFFYPSIAIRYTKSTDLITEESIALITTNRTLTVCSTVSSARNCSGRLIYSMWMFLNLSLT